MELLLIFLAAIPIGIFGILIGGNAVLSIPLFQILYPEMTLGAIIGNIKPGSVVRNIASLVPVWRDLNYRTIAPLLIPLVAGSAIAALLVSSVSQAWVLPVLMLGWLVVEYAPKLAHRISPNIQWAGAWLVGMYGGVLGAGVSLLILSLLRIQNPAGDDIYLLRAHALWLETLFTSAAVAVFLYQGLVFWPIALVWLVGALIGGYVGGRLLKYTGRLSGRTQTRILRAGFVFAIAVAASYFI